MKTVQSWRVIVLLAAWAVGIVAPSAWAQGSAIPFAPGDTLEEIQEKIDVNGYNFTVNHNWVFDMPAAEKAKWRSRRPSAQPSKLTTGTGPLLWKVGRQVVPSAYCWTNVNGHAYIGPVRDQGSCGSCYAFGACAAAEGTYNKAMGLYDGACVDFSESYIAWCLGSLSAYSSHFSGCDGADYDYYELQALTRLGTTGKEGVCLESDFPYQTSAPGSTDSYWAKPRRLFEFWHRVPCLDVEAIKTAIMTYGVVDAAVDVSSAFEAYSGGIYEDTATACSGSPCENTITDHAIALVGWNDADGTNGHWILRNSWGTRWGENGYMRIRYTSARVSCSVCYLVFDTNSVATPTPTPTLSATATATPTVYVTATPTPAVTGTPTAEPTVLGTSTPTPTLSVTATPTVFPTGTATPAVTATPPVYPSATPTAWPTGMPTPRPTPTPAGMANLSVYSESQGVWAILLSSTFAVRTVSLGGPGYQAVAGDYDGDGITDLAVYHRTSGVWSVLLSRQGGAWISTVLGGPGYEPMTADYDGDAKSDPAVYQSSTGDWWVLMSGNGYTPAVLLNFGGVAYLPVPGDYDGDAKVDPSVMNTSFPLWAVRFSGSAYLRVSAPLGGPDVAPIVGDYDGDAKADPALYMENAGVWWVPMSGSGYAVTPLSFGGPGFAAAPGDVDGDGKADYLVYEQTSGLWVARLSSQGYMPVTDFFGGPGYVPAGVIR